MRFNVEAAIAHALLQTADVLFGDEAATEAL